MILAYQTVDLHASGPTKLVAELIKLLMLRLIMASVIPYGIWCTQSLYSYFLRSYNMDLIFCIYQLNISENQLHLSLVHSVCFYFIQFVHGFCDTKFLDRINSFCLKIIVLKIHCNIHIKYVFSTLSLYTHWPLSVTLKQSVHSSLTFLIHKAFLLI